MFVYICIAAAHLQAEPRWVEQQAASPAAALLLGHEGVPRLGIRGLGFRV